MTVPTVPEAPPGASSPIRGLLADRQVVGLFAASVVGRLPSVAVTLVLILHVRDLTGSFAAGGLAAGAWALGFGLTAPLLGRLVDRTGQTRVLVAGALTTATTLAALAALPAAAPLGAVVALAAAGGAAHPPLGPCLRALWGSLLRDPDRLHAAYALESVALELTYVLGPLVVVGAIATHSPPAALLTCSALLLAGTAAFAATRASRGAERSRAPRARGGALRSPQIRVLLVALSFVAVSFGVLEISIPAFAEREGARAATGPLLAAWGIGSILGGVAAARAGAPADPARRLARLLALLAAGYAPLALAGGPLLLGALMIPAGVAIAPAIATAYGLLSAHAPAGTVTEAFAWAGTAMGAGLAAGAALGGALAEHAGAPAGFLLAVGAAAAACVVVAAAGRLRARASAPAGTR